MKNDDKPNTRPPKPGLTPEMMKAHKTRAESLNQLAAGREVAAELLASLRSDAFLSDDRFNDPVAADAFRRVTGVLGALLGVEDREEVDSESDG
jgi:hypothetical protein